MDLSTNTSQSLQIASGLAALSSVGSMRELRSRASPHSRSSFFPLLSLIAPLLVKVVLDGDTTVYNEFHNSQNFSKDVNFHGFFAHRRGPAPNRDGF